MTIAEYQELTGVTVSDANIPKVAATLNRAQAKLELLLGYPLSKQKTWTELGKARYFGGVPFPSLPISDQVLDNLDAPDDEIGKYQLFNFHESDKHFRINPAKEVYRAKIVLPVNDGEFITIQELPNVVPYINETGLVVGLTRYYSWFMWTWWPSMTLIQRSKLMLAVDAKYVNVCDANKYGDLMYLFADMVAYYSDPNYSVMGNIRSESIDSHSYSRAGAVAPTKIGATLDYYSPEGQPSARLIIDKYAGPAAFRMKVQ